MMRGLLLACVLAVASARVATLVFKDKAGTKMVMTQKSSELILEGCPAGNVPLCALRAELTKLQATVAQNQKLTEARFNKMEKAQAAVNAAQDKFNALARAAVAKTSKDADAKQD